MTVEMDGDRFARLVAAYGAQPSRWPMDERHAAELFAGRDPGARALLGQADAIDALLFEHHVAPPAAALEAMVLAGAPDPAPRRHARLWWSGVAIAAAGAGALAGSAAAAALAPIATILPGYELTAFGELAAEQPR